MGAPKLCKSDPGICHRATEGTEVKRAWVGDGAWGGSGRGRRRAGFFATFTAHDSRRGARGQLYGVTVEVQLAREEDQTATRGKNPPFARNGSANNWPPVIYLFHYWRLVSRLLHSF